MDNAHAAVAVMTAFREEDTECMVGHGHGHTVQIQLLLRRIMAPAQFSQDALLDAFPRKQQLLAGLQLIRFQFMAQEFTHHLPGIQPGLPGVGRRRWWAQGDAILAQRPHVRHGAAEEFPFVVRLIAHGIPRVAAAHRRPVAAILAVSIRRQVGRRASPACFQGGLTAFLQHRGCPVYWARLVPQ